MGKVSRHTLVDQLTGTSLDESYFRGKRAQAQFLPIGLGHLVGAWWGLRAWGASRRLRRVRLLLKAARDTQEAQADMHRPGRKAKTHAAAIRDQHRNGPPHAG